MDKRQSEVEKLLLDYEKQCIKDLQKTYTEALADVKLKLRSLLGRDPTLSVAYQIEFQRTLEAQLQNAIDTLKSGSITSVTDFLNKTYEDGYLGTIYSIQGQGIPINIGVDHKQAARVINRKTDTFKFSDRLYKNVDELAVAFKSEMTRGIANDSGYTMIARQLSLVSEASYKRALTIVRTEGGRVKSEAKLDSMKAAKDEGADIVKQWDATFDGKTRPEHRYLDGQIREIDEPFTDSQGREAQAPHKFGVASMDINCRCIVVERARWAVEGEEMPNKVDNLTGDLVEADNYKEWKEKAQRQLNEKKENEFNKRKEELENKGVKVFDKNTKNIPKKGDYFQTANKELVEITEISDYNGIKTATLADGQNVVLKNVKAEGAKLKADNFPKAYRDNKKRTEQTQILTDYINGVEGADENCKQLLSRLGELEHYGQDGVGFSVGYTEQAGNSFIRRERDAYTYELKDVKINVPLLEGSEIDGAVRTVVHENGHLLDELLGDGDYMFSEKYEPLKDYFRANNGRTANSEIKELFAAKSKAYDEISVIREQMLNAVNETYENKGFANYKEYIKAWNKTKKIATNTVDKLTRNAFDGVEKLQDIYDALNGGLNNGSGLEIVFGHGFSYYDSVERKCGETFANYFSLKLTKPDMVEVLRRDKPELCDILDEMIEEMLKKAR